MDRGSNGRGGMEDVRDLMAREAIEDIERACTCNCCVETVERKGLGPEMSEGGEGGKGRGGAEQFDSRAL